MKREERRLYKVARFSSTVNYFGRDFFFPPGNDRASTYTPYTDVYELHRCSRWLHTRQDGTTRRKSSISFVTSTQLSVRYYIIYTLTRARVQRYDTKKPTQFCKLALKRRKKTNVRTLYVRTTRIVCHFVCEHTCRILLCTIGGVRIPT